MLIFEKAVTNEMVEEKNAKPAANEIIVADALEAQLKGSRHDTKHGLGLG